MNTIRITLKIIFYSKINIILIGTLYYANVQYSQQIHDQYCTLFENWWNCWVNLHESRIFLMRMFVAFLLLTAPHSRNANPHCITKTKSSLSQWLFSRIFKTGDIVWLMESIYELFFATPCIRPDILVSHGLRPLKRNRLFCISSRVRFPVYQRKKHTFFILQMCFFRGFVF